MIDRSQMVKYGITSVETLHTVKERDSKHELIELMEHDVKQLTIASEWLLNNNINVLRDFDESLFRKILRKERNHGYIKFYIRDCLGSPPDEDKLRSYNYVKNKSGLLDLIIDEVIASTMKSQNLKDKCGKFDYNNFIGEAVRDLHEREGSYKEDDGKRMGMKYVISAPMQSGKTGVKGILQSLGGVLGMPTIVLTKGVTESTDLHKKLVQYAEGTTLKREHVVVGEYYVKCTVKILDQCTHCSMYS
jgi:hypothetical protein